ncbi:hypothetical protein ACHAXT_003395 [Thalassiosira profunda]
MRAASASSLLLLLAARRIDAFGPALLPGRAVHRTVALRSYLDNLSGSPSDVPRWTTSDAPRWTTTDAAPVGGGAPSTSIAKLNLEIADALASGVVAVAKRNYFPPIVVSVLDKSANMLVQKRMDGDVHAAFPEFSYAKAYTCVTMNTSSRDFQAKYTKENDPGKIAQVNSMMAITGKMAAFPGGVALRNGDGDVVGAIGVSGAAGDEDEYAALRAVWESGLPLTTQPAEHSCSTARD